MPTRSLPAQPVQPAPRVRKRAITRALPPLSGTGTYLSISWSNVKFLSRITSLGMGISEFCFSSCKTQNGASTGRRFKVMSTYSYTSTDQLRPSTWWNVNAWERCLACGACAIVSCTTDSLCDEFMFSDFLCVNATAEPIFNTLSAYLVSNDIPFSDIIG